jgi:hypothetical protein
MMKKGTVAMGVVAFLIGLGLGIVGFSRLGSTSNPVISGVGTIDETVIADIHARRLAELALRLDAVGPVTDAMLLESLNAVAANAAGGDVRALSVLAEIAQLQREQQ